MWIPKTEEDLRSALESMAATETSILDFKREVGSKSREIAKDIAAMANDGGVIIYGVAEDKGGKPTILSPFPLEGVAERIDAIARSGIVEPPRIEIKEIVSEADTGRGYLAVIVPASPRAPHMVEVGKDFRYYGRSSKGNTPLTQPEVEKMYARRESWNRNRELLLQSFIDKAPIRPTSGEGHLHLFAQPVFGDDNRLYRAARGRENIMQFLTEMIDTAVTPGVYKAGSYDPDFWPSSWRRCPTGWTTRMGSSDDARSMLNVTADFDGTLWLFCGGAGDTGNDVFELYESIVAGLTIRFLVAAGFLSGRSGHLGPVDIGLAVTGIRGVVSYEEKKRQWRTRDLLEFHEDSYVKTTQTSATVLKADPKDVAQELVNPLIRSLTQAERNPYAGDA